MSVDDVVYRLTPTNEICFVNDEWDSFARKNDAPHLVREKILTRKLWDFISDAQTLQIYMNLVSRVRSGQPAHFDYRCDAPSLRRFMTMDMLLLEEGMVEFRTRAVKTEARQPQSLFARLTTRSNKRVTVCGWCRKIRVGEQWVEVEQAVVDLNLFEQDVVPLLTHGLCEACDARMENVQCGT